jgi:hypothetical protein
MNCYVIELNFFHNEILSLCRKTGLFYRPQIFLLTFVLLCI